MNTVYILRTVAGHRIIGVYATLELAALEASMVKFQTECLASEVASNITETELISTRLLPPNWRE